MSLKKIQDKMLKRAKMISSNKKGQLGMNTVKAFMIIILTVAIIAFAIVIAMGTLNDANVLTQGTLAANQTTNILNNVSEGVASFFSDSKTWFTLLSVVVIILIISIVIFAVSRFGGAAGGGGVSA